MTNIYSNRIKIFKNTFTVAVAVLFCYQCFDSFSKYSSYPTSTTTHKKDLKDLIVFPSFVLCPRDGVNLRKLLEKGYESMSDFYMGRLNNGKRGWGGLKNESFNLIANDTRIFSNDR